MSETALAELERQLRATRARMAELANVPELLREEEDRLRGVRADAVELSGDLEVKTMEWLRERQDAETHLQSYRDRARELKTSMDSLESTGAEAPCPTCGRLLESHLKAVMERLGEEWDSIVQDGQWWRRRREQLELKPHTLQELEGASIRVHAEVEKLAESVEHQRSALRELEELWEHDLDLVRRIRAEVEFGPTASAPESDDRRAGGDRRQPPGVPSKDQASPRSP